MSSVFTKIINGDLPGRFVHRSDDVVAFLTIEPITEGHTLVVPVREVDHWIDLERDEMSRLMHVARLVGRAIDAVYEPTRIGMMIAGLEVPHTHVHVLPIDSESDLRFANARAAEPEDLDRVANLLSTAIQELDEG